MDPAERGFRLTSRQRRQLERRLGLRGMTLVQPPGDDDAAQVRANVLHGPIEGVPFDVVQTLEALRLLAEGGNRIAAYVYARERERWDIR